MSTFAIRLRRARQAQSISQAQLGRAASLSQSAIASYEMGPRVPSHTLYRLARALDVDVGWLLEGQARRMASTPWPFAAISQADYLALSDADRQAIEAIVVHLLGRHAASPPFPQGQKSSL